MSCFFAELFCGFPGIFDAAVQTKGLPKICFFLKDKCPIFVSPKIMFCHPFTFLQTYVIFTITKKYGCTRRKRLLSHLLKECLL